MRCEKIVEIPNLTTHFQALLTQQLQTTELLLADVKARLENCLQAKEREDAAAAAQSVSYGIECDSYNRVWVMVQKGHIARIFEFRIMIAFLFFVTYLDECFVSGGITKSDW